MPAFYKTIDPYRFVRVSEIHEDLSDETVKFLLSIREKSEVYYCIPNSHVPLFEEFQKLLTNTQTYYESRALQSGFDGVFGHYSVLKKQ